MIVEIKSTSNEHLAVSINGHSNKLELFEALEHVKTIYGREYDYGERTWKISIPNIEILIKKLERAGIEYRIYKKARDKIEKYKVWRNKQFFIKNQYEINIGEVLLKKPRPYQTTGTSFALLGRKAIIADGVGLGKTIQALAASEVLFKRGISKKTLVICPSTLKKKWGKEIEDFTGQDYIIIDGNKDQRIEQYKESLLNENIKYVIISYDLIRHDSFLGNQKGIEEFELIKKEIRNWSLVIDEVQYIKNSKAKRTIVAKDLINKSKYCFGLSATYIELGLEDVFWIFNSLVPTVFGDQFWVFADKHIVYNEYTGKIVSYKNTKLIKNKIKPYVIRRFREEVLEQLPSRIEKTYWVNLSKEQRRIYNEIKKNIIDSISGIEKMDKVIRANVLTNMNYLRQTCLSTELMEAKENHSTKLEELKRIIVNDLPKSKMVIFCYYKKMVEIIHRELSNIGLKGIYMHGSYPKKHKDRWDLIQEFQKEREWNFLATSDILAEGHDLQFANILINYDLLWNPAKMEQRNGRIDRIGQKHSSIIIINIVSNDTVEEYMWGKLEKRKEIIQDVVDDNFVSTRLNYQTIKEVVGV